MSQYNVFNTASGEELGRYFARSMDDALNAMARVAGYDDYRHACAAVPRIAEQLVVTEL